MLCDADLQWQLGGVGTSCLSRSRAYPPALLRFFRAFMVELRVQHTPTLSYPRQRSFVCLFQRVTNQDNDHLTLLEHVDEQRSTAGFERGAPST